MADILERGIDRKLASLRISRHPRGHIADCNGSIEAVRANVEPCRDFISSSDSQIEALLVEKRLYQKLIDQSKQVENFQKKVKERVKKRIKETSLENLLSSCPPPSVKVEKHKLAVQSALPKFDCDREVRITKRRNERQRAVRKLLSVSEYADETMEVPDNTHVGERGSKEVSMKVMESWESNPKPTRIKKSISFLPPDKIKLAQRKELAAQHLAVRRIYSALERQQSRADAERRQIQSSVDKLKNKRERERRMIEERETYSSGEDEEERQRWLETIALERRHQKLQKEKEMDRYFEALHSQMKEKLPDDLPSLCPCHSSLWKSDPNLCARNCQYYQNHSRFASALKSLLKSVS